MPEVTIVSHVLLNKLSVKGIKSLSTSCVLTFAPGGRVKAVYGANGAGKTALILGALVLKRLLFDVGFLTAEKRFLIDIINRQTQAIVLSAVFTVEGKKYEYAARIGFSGELPALLSERYEQFVRGAKKKTVFACEDGAIVESDAAIPLFVKGQTSNRLSQSSFLSLIRAESAVDSPAFEACRAIASVRALDDFARSLCVYLPGVDGEVMGRLHEIAEGNQNGRRVIPVSQLAAYQEETKRLSAFVRIVKPELKGIVVDHRVVSKGIVPVEGVFDYGGGCKIGARSESTGVRALMDVFPFLSAAMDGSIVFIDELDTGINGILLRSILSYVNEYAQGQFCFTTHDSHLMGAVEKNKYGLCFLAPDGGITSWIKNGNYNPEKQWNEGFIPGFAFNYEPLDFFPAFPNTSGNRD